MAAHCSSHLLPHSAATAIASPACSRLFTSQSSISSPWTRPTMNLLRSFCTAQFAKMGPLPIDQEDSSDLAARLAKLGVKDVSSVKTELYPPIEPNSTGFLPVSDIHTLYWEESGNPAGKRGAGKSTPHGCLDENTTWDLVNDIEKLREHLKIQK